MTQKLLFLSPDFRTPRRPRVSSACVPSRPRNCARGPCEPRASQAFPGPSVAASRPGGAPGRRPRRPHCGPGQRRGLLLPPGRAPRSSERPRVPAHRPRGGAAPTSSPPLPPAWARAFGCGRGAPRRPSPGTPRSPISPSSSSSSSCSMSNRTSLVIICTAPPKAAPNLARSWGSRVPERRGSRGPGARLGPAGRVSLPAQGPLHQPAPRKAEPRRPPTRTQRPGYHSPLSMPSARRAGCGVVDFPRVIRRSGGSRRREGAGGARLLHAGDLVEGRGESTRGWEWTGLFPDEAAFA